MTAKEILLKAVQCDQFGRILEAQNLYQDGIQILMDMVGKEANASKKKVYYERIKEYIDRAEQIKERVQRQVMQGELIANIPIDNDATGHGYFTLFGKFLNADVKEVLLEEPYLQVNYHFQNLVTFFELLVKHCKTLKYIRLVTKPNGSNQTQILEQIRNDLGRRGCTLSIKFEDTLHDRKIVLSSGYIIKIGRGLHFYKATQPQYSLGLSDYDFRRCYQTDVDIWRTKNFIA